MPLLASPDAAALAGMTSGALRQLLDRFGPDGRDLFLREQGDALGAGRGRVSLLGRDLVLQLALGAELVRFGRSWDAALRDAAGFLLGVGGGGELRVGEDGEAHEAPPRAPGEIWPTDRTLLLLTPDAMTPINVAPGARCDLLWLSLHAGAKSGAFAVIDLSAIWAAVDAAFALRGVGR